MGVAFEMTRVALGLADRGDLANEIIAKRIIALAKAGGRNPDLLCEGVLKEFRISGSGPPQLQRPHNHRRLPRKPRNHAVG